MKYSCCLTNTKSPLVLDTSVIINLHASGEAKSIIETLPNPIMVTENVLNEIRGEYNDSSAQKFLLRDLQAQELIAIVPLSEGDLARYTELVSEPRSLDDGEAATIAVALENNHIAVVDERKGLQRLQDEKPGCCTPTTIDLLLHPSVINIFGTTYVADLVFNALSEARMRILLEHREAVVDLIGIERALKCNSLPNFKQWRGQVVNT
ncbi:hypothetical protein BTA51_11365 [Hahella sp. CCB-MM4]|uniref:PIN domain-containing protein n=1 Tax=Hahella sp. (strain CCB-MM4) TaxID=1926491 RepID=UPI000BD0FA90|nr:PIN domain-containing protein [Hahella sp. CCB-MM4]OZG73089.1 hypothetical protein BTA51_11365 [Hahella sp. CCB-MM4]